MTAKIGAAAYRECSTRNREEHKAIFDTVIAVALDQKPVKPLKSRRGCVLQ